MDSINDSSNCTLGGFGWLDANKSLRRWFSRWLADNWRMIYRESLHRLNTKEDWIAYDAMEGFVKSIRAKLVRLSTAEQVALIDAEARKFNFSTTRERVEEELRYFLTRSGRAKKHAAAFKASPWCNHFATTESILKQAGKEIPHRLYPDDPNARLALESVISEFGSLEIQREVSPVMSNLFAVQRALNQIDSAIKLLPVEASVLSAFQKLEPELDRFSSLLQAAVAARANDPAEYIQPLRERRNQRCVYYAVRRLCKQEDGPKKLAGFVVNLLKKWPYVPAGFVLELEEHFNADFCRMLVRKHLGLRDDEMNKERRALWRIVKAIVYHEELRSSLLRLAKKARQLAQQRRKGWQQLHKALRTVFNHVGRELSEEEKMRNFERANYPHMRHVNRERRMQLLPELGNDPDHSVRDLTKRERMILFQRFNGTKSNPDADGKGSFDTRYGRAMKAVKKELGQE